jgi:O-antigen/teichoic acid export membrane protein
MAGLAANVVLLVALVPPLGIAGAGLALCGAYVVMLSVMYLLTRSAFSVDFEWGRLAQIVVVMGAVAAAGELLLPTHGVIGLVARAFVFLAIPPLLYLTRFPHEAELGQLRRLLRRARHGATA